MTHYTVQQLTNDMMHLLSKHISYGLLRSQAKYKEFKPTYKKYLTKHVRSRFIKINASEWDIALFLPVERFEKASKSKVWGESRNAI